MPIKFARDGWVFILIGRKRPNLLLTLIEEWHYEQITTGLIVLPLDDIAPAHKFVCCPLKHSAASHPWQQDQVCQMLGYPTYSAGRSSDVIEEYRQLGPFHIHQENSITTVTGNIFFVR